MKGGGVGRVLFTAHKISWKFYSRGEGEAQEGHKKVQRIAERAQLFLY